MQKLISRCWSMKPEERPTFNEIYNELKNDFSYFGVKLDENEIKDYISTLEEDREEKANNFYYATKETEKLKEKINELKDQLKKYTTSNDIFIQALHLLHGNEKEAISFLKVASYGKSLSLKDIYFYHIVLLRISLDDLFEIL